MKLGTVQIYASIIGLKKHANQAWGSLYFADVKTFPPKTTEFLENNVHDFKSEKLCIYY